MIESLGTRYSPSFKSTVAACGTAVGATGQNRLTLLCLLDTAKHLTLYSGTYLVHKSSTIGQVIPVGEVRSSFRANDSVKLLLSSLLYMRIRDDTSQHRVKENSRCINASLEKWTPEISVMHNYEHFAEHATKNKILPKEFTIQVIMLLAFNHIHHETIIPLPILHPVLYKIKQTKENLPLLFAHLHAFPLPRCHELGGVFQPREHINRWAVPGPHRSFEPLCEAIELVDKTIVVFWAVNTVDDRCDDWSRVPVNVGVEMLQ